MTRAWLSVALVASVACESAKPEVQSSPEPSDKPVPRLSVSDQRRLKRPDADSGSGVGAGISPGVGGETDGREVDAGVGFRAEAKKGCSDQKCVGESCMRLCAKWTKENPPSSRGLENKVYLGCVGTCLTEVDQ